jgi:fumarate hydratase subunit beta
MKRLQLPHTAEEARSLRAGEPVLLTGHLNTARDAAHKRLIALLEAGEALPFPIAGETLYYVGPAPARPGDAVGSAGPTTSYRMDAYTPQLLRAGLRAMIGKGKRSPAVIEAMQAAGAVYLGATGGAAALIAQAIVKAEVVCYPDLGAEAVHRFEVRDFPAVVLIDSEGNNIYEIGPAQYRNGVE